VLPCGMSPRRPPQPEKIRHVFRIEDWTFDYSYSVGLLRPDEYTDSQHLKIEGSIIEPAKITAKRGTITCFPMAGLVGVDRSHVTSTLEKPASVGAVYYRGKSYQTHLFFPADALPLILQMLLAGKYRHVTFDAWKSGNEVFNFTFTDCDRRTNDEALP
jgi:hypothetical protein